MIFINDNVSVYSTTMLKAKLKYNNYFDFVYRAYKNILIGIVFLVKFKATVVFFF